MRFLAGPGLIAASLTLALAGPASAAETSPGTESPSVSVTGSMTITIPPTGSPEAGLTKEELQRQIARAEALRAEILKGGADIAAAMTKLDKATAKANAALEAYAKAKTEGRDARLKAKLQSETARNLQERLDKAREGLREWAVSAYTQGGPLAEQLGYLDALSKDADKASNPLSDLNYLTDNRIRSVEDIREIAVAQKRASMDADAERDKAVAAEAKAAKAKKIATDLVEDQQAGVDEVRRLHQERIAEVAPIAGLLLGSGDEDAISTSERLTDALSEYDITIKDLSTKPCTENTGVFPNGQIPPSHLCPMIGSNDEFLVPDAAAAFNAMSKAYAEETGSLLCVTDGYRSYAEQVAVKASRGPWAATPGTSEHGLGRAVDLCGGVQDYSAPAHLWLKQNAALFGWFHPSWAEQGGTLPEPWHWEYAG